MTDEAAVETGQPTGAQPGADAQPPSGPPQPSAATAQPPTATTQPPTGASADELIELIDRLERLLQSSELAEIEVEAGELAIVLRTPAALHPRTAAIGAPQVAGSAASDPAVGQAARGGTAPSAGSSGTQAVRGASSVGPGGMPADAHRAGAGDAGIAEAAPQTHLVLAPLTGIFYGAPSPGAEAYVRIGDQVASGQVIGLIEAMKLFNEIKSDAGGRVVRLHAENGKLVKARQPLLELEPL